MINKNEPSVAPAVAKMEESSRAKLLEDEEDPNRVSPPMETVCIHPAPATVISEPKRA